LPYTAYFFDLVEIEISHQQFILIFRSLGEDLSTGVYKIGAAIKPAEIPRFLFPYTVDTPHEITVGGGMGRLLQVPEILRKPRYSGRGIVYDLGAIKPQDTGAIGEMTVITYVYPDLRILCLEDGIAKVAGLEEELLPEAGSMWDMVLPVFPQKSTVCIDDSSRIVKDPGLLFFIHRHDHDHIVFFGIGGHPLHGGSGYRLRRVIPGAVLPGAEIRGIEYFLETKYLYTTFSRLLDERDMLLKHGFFDLFDSTFSFCLGETHLDES
jgi:hypothetical protein